MKSEYESFMKINEYNKGQLFIKEEDEGDSIEISVAIEEKLVDNLINNEVDFKLGNFIVIYFLILCIYIKQKTR